jgi:hypothetical protein
MTRLNSTANTARTTVLTWARRNVTIGGRTPRMSATCSTDPTEVVSTCDVWESAGSGRRNRVARVRVSPTGVEVIN